MRLIQVFVVAITLLACTLAFAEDACPSGTKREAAGKVCVPQSCAKGFERSQDRKSCIPAAKACPSGTRRSPKGTECIHDVCGPGMMPTVDGHCMVGV